MTFEYSSRMVHGDDSAVVNIDSGPYQVWHLESNI